MDFSKELAQYFADRQCLLDYSSHSCPMCFSVSRCDGLRCGYFPYRSDGWEYCAVCTTSEYPEVDGYCKVGR